MPAEPPKALNEYPVMITLPVLWGDMDAFGHVNNTIPIRWFESARIAYLEQASLDHALGTAKLGPILAAISCSYRRQIVYPDTVHVGTTLSRMGRTSLTLRHAVYSDKLGQVAADGESVVVIFDYHAQRPVRVPAEVRALVEKLEERPGPINE